MINKKDIEDTLRYISNKYNSSGMILCNPFTFEICKELLKDNKYITLSEKKGEREYDILEYKDFNGNFLPIIATAPSLEENEFDVCAGKLGLEKIMSDDKRNKNIKIN